jgi:NAD dependent epimerase/dehydratase
MGLAGYSCGKGLYNLKLGMTTLKGSKVLVTGAGGFIGSHLTERLVSEGAEVRALTHYRSDGNRGWLEGAASIDDIEVIAGDIRDPDSVRKATEGRDVVFHLAALIGIPYSYDAPRSYIATNIEGTVNVLQAARAAQVERLVHTSTSETYGTAQYVPIDEKHPLQGQSPYSASKIGADKMVEAFHQSFQLPAVTVRPFNTFGPRQSARAIIPTIISQCLELGKVTIGSRHPTRDFNFVDNTVDGFLAAATSDQAVGRTVNLGFGQEISIGDLADRIIGLVGGEIPITHAKERVRPDGSEVDRLLAGTGLAAEVLNWTPRVSLDDGLRRTIAWLRENLERYRPDEYSV